MQTLAILGTLLLFLCPLPQTIGCIKNGHSDGLNGYGIIMWFIGCSCMVAYLVIVPGTSVFVICNFCFGIVFSLVQGFYKLFPRKP
jgi:uncharacterized protein with PQ loop repeat